MTERIKLDGLLAVRCFAALMIVLFHLIRMPNLPTPDGLGIVKNHFAIGVPLFYIVSAFSLMIGYRERLATRNDLRIYFLRRFFRIAPLFYLMMAVYLGYLYAVYGKVIGWERVVSSGLFIFNFIPAHASGYVWASWSIGVEMAFYLILPILVFALTDLKRSIAFFLLSVFMLSQWTASFAGTKGDLQAFRDYSLINYLPFFAAGVVLYYAWLRIRGRPTIGLILLPAGLFAIAGTMLFSPEIISVTGMTGYRTLQALTLAVFVAGITLWTPKLLVNKVTKSLGDASFSLYLLHPLIIGILMACKVYAWIYEGTPSLWLAYVMCAVITLVPLFILSLASFRLIEKPGNDISKRFIPTRASAQPNPHGAL